MAKGKKKAPSASWSPNPLNLFKSTKQCVWCNQGEVDPTNNPLRRCEGCVEYTHRGCSLDVREWVLKMRVEQAFDRKIQVCRTCRERFLSNADWLKQNGIDWARPGAQDKYRAWSDERDDREEGKAWSYFDDSMFQTDKDLQEARNAVKRITDLVYTGSGSQAWRVIFGQPDMVPHAKLAMRQLHLPDIFIHPRAARMKKSAIMDILTGLALHEAGHGEYTTVDASRRVVTEAWPEIGLQQTVPMVWWYDAQVPKNWDYVNGKHVERPWTDAEVADNKRNHPSDAHRWRKAPDNSQQPNIQGDPVKRQHVQLMWNLVEDFYLEHKLRERFPGWDSYLHMAYVWMWAKAFDHLKEALANHPDPENSLTIRTTIAIWRILAPEKIDGKLNPPRSLELLGDQARKLVLGRLFSGNLDNDDGKIRCALDLFTLLSNGCQFDEPPPPPPGNGQGKQQDGGDGQGQQQGSGKGSGNDKGESNGNSSGTNSGDSGSDGPSSGSGKQAPASERGDRDAEREGSGSRGDDDSDDGRGHSGQDDGKSDGDDGGAAGAGDDGADESYPSPSGAPDTTPHTDDYGWDTNSARGQGDASDSVDGAPSGNGGHGAGMGGGENVDKHQDKHLEDPTEIGAVKDEPMSQEEQKLLQSMLQGDGAADEYHLREREESKKFTVPVQWREDQKLTENHSDGYRKRKQRLEFIINRLKKNLQVRNVQADGRTGGHRRGRLDRRNLYRVVSQNETKVFAQKERKTLPKVRIGLLIDESGSMGSVTNPKTPASIARDTGTILAEAFEGIRGVKLWVTGYSTGYTDKQGHGNIVQSYVSPTRKKFEALEREIMNGGTPTGECMWKLAEVMSQGVAWDEQIVMFVITDGGYGGMEPAQVQTMFPKITFVEVLIGSGLRKQGLKYSIQVNNVNDFTDNMVKTISHILLGGQL